MLCENEHAIFKSNQVANVHVEYSLWLFLSFSINFAAYTRPTYLSINVSFYVGFFFANFNEMNEQLVFTLFRSRFVIEDVSHQSEHRMKTGCRMICFHQVNISTITGQKFFFSFLLQ